MRARLANDPMTAAYLAAAMRLIERRVGPAAERQPVDPEDLQFRAGITVNEFADMLNALAAGTRLHAVGDKNAQVIDHDPRCSLLGKAALALILVCVENAGSSTGKTIEEVANILASNHAEGMS